MSGVFYVSDLKSIFLLEMYYFDHE
jgi:hypothetical protein